MRAAVAAVVVAVAAALVMVLLLSRQPSPPAPSSSTAAESWSLPSLSGTGQVSLSQFRGHAVVVDFFASWCTSCTSELPEFMRVSQRLHGEVAFVGIDSEENGDGLGLARQTGIAAWPLARDVGGSQLSGLRESVEGVPGMPVTAFYDSGGHLVASRLGAMTGDALTQELRQLKLIAA
ncbi:MAG: TlpA family protein disulfide reductase [Candidatus Dormibacteria bacterium]